MNDKGKIIAFILVVVILIIFPIYPLIHNIVSGKASYRPEITLPKNEKQCVASKDYMTEYHMDLLNQWRDKVVREGERMFRAPDGKQYEMSLTKTCLKCHTQKDKFCDKCHTYLAVDPYCWDCHIVPKEVR